MKDVKGGGWTMEDGRWRMWEDGEWRIEDRQWTMEGAGWRWRMEEGQCGVNVSNIMYDVTYDTT